MSIDNSVVDIVQVVPTQAGLLDQQIEPGVETKGKLTL